MTNPLVRSLQACALAQLALGAGCSDDDSGKAPADAAVAPDAKTADDTDAASSGNGDASATTAALFGGFVVKFVAAVPATATRTAKPATTSVIGKLLDAESPDAIIWELADEADGCQLRTPRVPFCDPGCGGVATCVEDGKCTDNPVSQDVGTVDVSGVGPAPFSMKLEAGNYQYAKSSSWPFPACDEGGAIEVESQRSAYDALDLKANCIAPLETAGDVAIESGKPLALTWTPPADAELTRIHVKVDISHHGGAKGVIECDVADNGSFAIPKQLVQQLVDLGVAGFPSVTVSRVSIGHGNTPLTQAVSLTITSSVDREIEIPGLVSCNDDSECEDDQTCQTDATCK